MMKYIFNPLLGRSLDEELKIDRVHGIRKPPSVREDVPRDIIVKFHQYEDKAKIWSKLRGIRPVKFKILISKSFPTYQLGLCLGDAN